MAQPYVGEIRMFAGNFAPAGWMFCEGQLLADQRERDPVPADRHDLRRRRRDRRSRCPTCAAAFPIHQGNGFILAETGGAEEITLTVNQIAGAHPSVAGLDSHRGRPRPVRQQRAPQRQTAITRTRADATQRRRWRRRRSRRRAAASRTRTSSRTCASTSSFRCSGSSRPRPKTGSRHESGETNANRRRAHGRSVCRRDPDLSVQLRAQGLGVVRRPVAAAVAEHRAVLAARNDLRRRRQVELRAARPAGARADASRPGTGPVASRPRRDRRQRDGDAARVGDSVAPARACMASARSGDSQTPAAERRCPGPRRRSTLYCLPAGCASLVAMSTRRSPPPAATSRTTTCSRT